MPINEGVGPGELTEVLLKKSDGTEIATSSDPLRTDPTGTTTQPISAASLPLPTGASTSANQDTHNTRIGDLTETAPGTDTASSGLNGRLQRIAQRITSLITTLTDRTAKVQITNGTIDAGLLDSTPLNDSTGLVVRSVPNRPQTFSVHADNQDIGNGKSMLSLFNAGGSGVVLRLKRIKIFNTRTAATTGVNAKFGLRKITTHSGGTQLTTTGAAAGLIFPYDSTNSLNGSVTARTGGTVTESPAFDIEHWHWSSDEFGTGTADAETTEHTMAQLIAAWEAPKDAQELTARPGEGFHIMQATNSTNGTFDIVFIFSQESV